MLPFSGIYSLNKYLLLTHCLGSTVLALGAQRSVLKPCVLKELAKLPKGKRKEKCN